jgi:hypothetical protein
MGRGPLNISSSSAEFPQRGSGDLEAETAIPSETGKKPSKYCEEDSTAYFSNHGYSVLNISILLLLDIISDYIAMLQNEHNEFSHNLHLDLQVNILCFRNAEHTELPWSFWVSIHA